MMPTASYTQGMDAFIERVRQANPIRDVVSEHVKLDGNRGHCPFHPDTHPSFSVMPGRGTFKCFAASCGLAGDVIHFIRKVKHLPFRDALDDLARRAKLTAPGFLQQEINETIREQDVLDVIEFTAKTYAQRLSPKLRFYITEERKLPYEFIDRYLMGWADDGGLSGVHAVAQKYGTPGLGVMKAAGLARLRYDAMPGEIGYQDTFEDRLIVSTMHLGRVSFLSGRALRPDQDPKYYHQPGREAPLFDEERLDPERTFVTEGSFDALSLQAWEYPATAFYGGVRVSSIQKLRKVKSPIACFDGDRAGRAATMKLAAHLGPRLLAVRLPEPFDPNDFYRTRPRQEFDALVRQALDPVQFVLADIDRTWPTPLQIRELDLVIPYLVSLSTAMAEGYIEIIRDTLRWSRTVAKLYRDDVLEAREHTRTQCPACGTVLYHHYRKR
jgi:DNA primase